jgi:hypothetical protein
MSAAVGFMLGVWVVFGVVASSVLGSSIPLVAKLVLRGLAMEPPEVRIHHFASARKNSISGNSSSFGIVCLDRAFRLGPRLLGWSHPMSMRVWQWGIISCAVIKSAAAWILQQMPLQT